MPRRLSRPVAVVIVTAVIGFAFVTAVAAVVQERAPDRDHPHAAAPFGDPGAEPGTDSVEGRVADPGGGGPPWSVVVFRSRDGRTCAAAGRNVDGKVGAINRGRFSEYPIRDGASCADLDSVPAGVQITSRVGDDENTVVHGVAGDDVRSIEIRTPSGAVTPAIGRRGGFVAVFPSTVAIDEIDVIARLASGAERVLL